MRSHHPRVRPAHLAGLHRCLLIDLVSDSVHATPSANRLRRGWRTGCGGRRVGLLGRGNRNRPLLLSGLVTSREHKRGAKRQRGPDRLSHSRCSFLLLRVCQRSDPPPQSMDARPKIPHFSLECGSSDPPNPNVRSPHLVRAHPIGRDPSRNRTNSEKTSCSPNRMKCEGILKRSGSDDDACGS
jgi:hypothetical protein